MRHAKKRHRLGRTASHRKATLQALSAALIRHKRITTTVTKAKALRGFIEPIITRAKEDTTHNRREAFRHLQDKEAVHGLFEEVSEAVGDRPGGYTRVIKLGKRSGDAAEMAVIELVDFNDVKPEGGSSSRKRTRRGRGKGRRRSKAPAEATPEAAAEENKVEAADAENSDDESSEETEEIVDEADEGSASESEGALAEEQEAEEEVDDVTDEAEVDVVESPEDDVEAEEEDEDEGETGEEGTAAEGEAVDEGEEKDD